MSGFVSDLFEKMKAVTEEQLAAASFEEVSEGMVVLGEMPDDAKRLYVILEDLRKKVDDGMKNVLESVNLFSLFSMFETKDANLLTEKKEEINSLDETRRDLKLIRRLMWHTIRKDNPEYPENLAIRKGWKIVEYVEERCDCILCTFIKS